MPGRLRRLGVDLKSEPVDRLVQFGELAARRNIEGTVPRRTPFLQGGWAQRDSTPDSQYGTSCHIGLVLPLLDNSSSDYSAHAFNDVDVRCITAFPVCDRLPSCRERLQMSKRHAA
jgi:hypothetical protein